MITYIYDFNNETQFDRTKQYEVGVPQKLTVQNNPAVPEFNPRQKYTQFSGADILDQRVKSWKEYQQRNPHNITPGMTIWLIERETTPEGTIKRIIASGQAMVNQMLEQKEEQKNVVSSDTNYLNSPAYRDNKARIERLETDYADAHRQCTELMQEKQSYIYRLENAERENSILKQQIALHDDQLHAIQAEKSQLASDNDRLRRENETHAITIRAFEQEKERLIEIERKYDHIKALYDDAQKQLSLQDDYLQLKEQLQEYTKVRDDYRIAYMELKNHKEKIQTLEQEIRQLREKLETERKEQYNNGVEYATMKYNSEKALADLKTEMLMEKLQAKEDRIADLEIELEDKEEELLKLQQSQQTSLGDRLDRFMELQLQQKQLADQTPKPTLLERIGIPPEQVSGIIGTALKEGIGILQTIRQQPQQQQQTMWNGNNGNTNVAMQQGQLMNNAPQEPDYDMLLNAPDDVQFIQSIE